VSGPESNPGDWRNLNQSLAWIRDQGKKSNARNQPFFAYQGMNIVHPPVTAAKQYYD